MWFWIGIGAGLVVMGSGLALALLNGAKRIETVADDMFEAADGTGQ